MGVLKDYASRRFVIGLLMLAAVPVASLQAKSLSDLAKPAPEQATYRNDTYGFSFSYPAHMQLSEEFVGHYLVPAATWRVAYSTATGTPVVSLVVYRPNGESAYPDVEVRIGVNPGASADEACGWADEDDQLIPLGQTSLDGVAFKTFDLSDAAMQQFIEGVSYQTYRDGYCFAIERFLTDTIYVEDNPAAIKAKQAQDQATQAHYGLTEAIVKSFRFVDK